jgi:hypothetical protein
MLEKNTFFFFNIHIFFACNFEMNIREEILKLSSAAPVFKDQEDDFDYDGKIFFLYFCLILIY